jgi:hypothetical protein
MQTQNFSTAHQKPSNSLRWKLRATSDLHCQQHIRVTRNRLGTRQSAGFLPKH